MLDWWCYTLEMGALATTAGWMSETPWCLASLYFSLERDQGWETLIKATILHLIACWGYSSAATCCWCSFNRHWWMSARVYLTKKRAWHLIQNDNRTTERLVSWSILPTARLNMWWPHLVAQSVPACFNIIARTFRFKFINFCNSTLVLALRSSIKARTWTMRQLQQRPC